MALRAADAIGVLTQRLVDWRFRYERRRVAANGSRPVPQSRRALVREARRYVRRMRRAQATRSLPGHPAAHEQRVFSQNGEDGIIAFILDRVGVGGGVFVEIGAADGEENCTRALAETGNWRGLWIEGDPERAGRARARGEAIGVATLAAFVDRDNVIGLVASSGVVSGEIDVLVIDVDGNDWYLWREVARRWRPALVVTEVNGSLGPWVDWVMPYAPAHVWQEDRYHGATLRAFARLATTIGYTLVGCDSNGVNAFWVRDDLAGGFPAAGRVVRQYAPPAHAPPGGHPWCASAPFDGAALTLGELGTIVLQQPEFVDVTKPGSPNVIVVGVHNGSAHPIASGRDNPVRIAARWGAEPAPEAWTQPIRGSLSGIVAPGGSGTATVVLGPQTAQFATVDLVQEGVAWAHDAADWDAIRVNVARRRGLGTRVRRGRRAARLP